MSAAPALSGVRVLDLTELLPGPFATQMLADMGAEVIKIERPGSGDSYRTLRPAIFPLVNRGKKSVALNLKTPEGRKALLRLAQHADVLVEGYRPGVMQRLGLNYDVLKEINPRIIFVSLSGFGQTGPLSDFPGHDLNYNAIAGVLALCGTAEGPQHAVGVPVADLTSSFYAVISIFAALSVRSNTGEGQYLDVSITDCVLTLVGPRLGLSKKDVLRRAGNDVYETSDKRYIAIGAIEDRFWQRLVKVLAVPSLMDSRYAKSAERWQHTDVLDALIRYKIRERTHDEWIEILTQNDVPVTTVNDLTTLFDDPQLKQRGMFAEADGVRYVNYPVRMEGVAVGRDSKPPQLGEHTEALLTATGYSVSETGALQDKRDS